jgi:drug/metabolite transporter (DMT)-like permease
LLAVAGLGNAVGLLFAYSGLRIGKVGIVAPVTSTQGAIAAVIAVVAGERLAPRSVALLAVITVGVFLAGVTRGETGRVEAPVEDSNDARAAVYALVGALAFGASLFATGKLSAELPVAWALIPSRVIGVLAVTLPVWLQGGLRMSHDVLPLVLISGMAEVGGFALFAVGARHGIAVAAVLASQYAAIAAVAAYVLFRERLAPLQLAGVAAIVIGVGMLTAVQA